MNKDVVELGEIILKYMSLGTSREKRDKIHSPWERANNAFSSYTSEK